MCESFSTKCPEIRRNNSKKIKKLHDTGKIKVRKYSDYPEDTKNRMKWNKGLTKDDHPSIKRGAIKASKVLSGRIGTPHSIETRKLLSEKRIAFLEKHNSYNCKWYEVGGIKVQGTYELKFATFLIDNNIKFDRLRLKYCGWRTYTPDFYLSEYDIYVEVKGFLRERDKAKMKAVLNEHSIDLRLARKNEIFGMKTTEDIKRLPKVIDIIANEGIDYTKFDDKWLK